MSRLQNKRALVTGGSSGIGLETARRFLGEGARVAITGSSAASLEAARKELGGLKPEERRKRLRETWARLLGDVDPKAEPKVLSQEAVKAGGFDVHRVGHLQSVDPAGAWVAEDESDGSLVGMTVALRRERLWVLSLLGVSPSRQSAGGKPLWNRAKTCSSVAGSCTSEVVKSLKMPLRCSSADVELRKSKSTTGSKP